MSGHAAWSTFAATCVLVSAIVLGWASIASGQIVINEVHYDPEPKHERVEFIELYNAGGEAIDLSGWRFSRGIRFTFDEGSHLQPDAYLILTEDAEAYDKKFGSIFAGGARAFGQWDSGRLSNQADTLRLLDAAGGLRDEVDYRVGFPWPVAPNDQLGVSMELMHPSLDNELGSSWRPSESKPTPGLRNSVYTEASPPNIRQVDHAPQSPKPGEEVTIRAKITDPDGMGAVELIYQVVEPGHYIRLTDESYEAGWSAVPMHVNDSDPAFYEVTLPGDLQKHRHLIRYRIVFQDSLGNQARAPFPDDPTPNFVYFCYDKVPAWAGAAVPGETPVQVFGEDVLASLPIYHLIAREEDVLDCQYNRAFNDKVYRFLGTLVYNGRVYDHMRYRIRGHGSTYNTGKNKWKWRFNRGNLFEGHDNFGRKYPEPVRTLNLSAMASPWNPANRGICGLDEALSLRLWQMAGVPAVNTNYFHFRIIDDVAETNSNDQYEGDLWGPYLAMEQFDGRALRGRGLPDGNVYNMHFANSNYLNQGRDQPADRSDLTAFTSAGSGYNKTNPIQDVAWWREHVELDWYYSYRAVWETVNHSDQRDQENSIYYHNPETGRWSIHPWDVDLLYEEFDRWGPDAVQSTTPFEQFRKCLQHEELLTEFQNRARELQDLLLNDDQLWHLVDEFAGFVGSRSGNEESLPITALERSGVLNVATTGRPHGFTVGQTVYIKGAQPLSFSGEKMIESVPSPVQFAYKGSIFSPAPEPPGPETSVSATPAGGGWWEIDQARWNRHPLSRAVEGPSTGTGSFYVNPFRYTRFPGKVRELISPDFDGMVDWVKRFTVPGGFGGDQLQVLADGGPKEPDKPIITYTGPEGYPIDRLDFESSAFGGGTLFVEQRFTAMKWRLAEVRNPGTPNYVPGEPMIFEIDAVWESEEIATFEESITLPPDEINTGRTYRVRVRHKNDLGHWSHWSDAIEFQATADISAYADLVISEIMYHPAPLSEEEAAAGYEEADFEYIELWNRGKAPVELRLLRFTKGIEFDFDALNRTMLDAGATLILARNPLAFALRYGAGIEVASAWSSRRLDNAGERLKLSLGGGVPVIDFDYNDEDPWSALADGHGHSLEFAGYGDPNDPAQWRASAPGGSPGSVTGEAEPQPGPALRWSGVEFGDEDVTLKWLSVAGRRYVLEQSKDLRNWERPNEVLIEGKAEITETRLLLQTGVGAEPFYVRIVELGEAE